MEPFSFSFIIPVYNRPDEIEELLGSFEKLKGTSTFEVLVVEDGSNQRSDGIVAQYRDRLNISYYFKKNTGPGDSRNFGMQKASGNYFIILDSDCLLPQDYLLQVKSYLQEEFVDCYGGPDASHPTFSNIQKAIDFSMTSLISTGGIRGGKMANKDFQPRSFNMGISEQAFLASGGFGDIHPGEDPDLAIRLKKLGFKIALFPKAFVYHKRRVSLIKFYRQVNKFGMARPILNSWHPKTKKLVFWFPSLFMVGLLCSTLLMVANIYLPIAIYAGYFAIAFVVALFQHKTINIALLSIIAIFIQFFGYGSGFLKSFFYTEILKKNPRLIFPNLFFVKRNS